MFWYIVLAAVLWLVVALVLDEDEPAPARPDPAPPPAPGDDPPGEAELLHELCCSVCGAVCVRFEKGVYAYRPQGPELIFRGITRNQPVSLALADRIVPLLAQGDLRSVDELLEPHMEGGLDAYCAPCDKIYCREHFAARVEYDDGFYDATYGRCPAGHTKKLDD
jgi:hypothetical protein